MTKLTVFFWRDIPAQLMIGSGRRAIKQKLPEKYEKAIDRCAMKVGAKDTESYLADWRKKSVVLTDFDENTINEEAAKIEIEYSDEKLNALIRNNGWTEESKKKLRG